jgi:hypothetical protein
MSEITTTQSATEQAIALSEKVMVDTQISTAKAFPRNVKNVFENALTTATINLEIAQSCTYTVPRAGKNITGDSIRLAEIIAGEWGNLQRGKRVLGVEGKMVKAEAVVWDLEKNNRVTVQESRRITTSKGELYGDDMIQTTGKAAASIAMRNAIFDIIPRAFSLAIMEKVREYIKNPNPSDKNAKSIPERIDSAMKAFGTRNIPPNAILTILKKDSVADLNGDDLIEIIGMWNALRDNVITVDEILNPPPEVIDDKTGEVKTKGDSILDKINSKK